MKRPQRIWPCIVLFLLSLAWLPLSASAHQPSDSYLRIDSSDGDIGGSWDINLMDLELALGLDLDGNGEVTWGEVRHRHGEIADLASRHLALSRNSTPCDLQIGDLAIDEHGGLPYVGLDFEAECPARGTLEGRYDLFFELDPSHRGLLRLTSDDGVQSLVLSPQQRTFQLEGEASHALISTFRTYLREGVVHIWGGLDHILFLLTLLLPAVLLRRNGSWEGQVSWRVAALQVVKIVTAFTVAHSLTLIAAVLGWIHLPSSWVEPIIALTVVLAALNNLRPVVHDKVWGLAFVLGLIHGFGFAGVLAELQLTGMPLLVALGSFNLGVEVGQLAIVLVFLPVAFALRNSRFYQRVVLIGGSLCIAAIAANWLFERTLGWSLWTL